MRVIIVGAGIGGLSAAVALRRAGIAAVVLEQSPELSHVGAGISLFSNAMRALERLGVRDEVAARGAEARRVEVLRPDGRVMARTPQDVFEGAVALHRGDLQAALAEAAGEVRLGSAVAAIEQDDDGATARLADGSAEQGDLLVGADGIGSVVRRELAPSVRPHYSGYTAWRGVADLEIEPGRWTETWGVGHRFGLLDLGGGRTYWFATKNVPEGEADEEGGRREELLRRFDDWHEPVRDAIERTEEASILRHDVYDLEPLPSWSEGRLVLLGDAAHATTPGIGQGAAQAIEDAVVLVECLEAEGSIPDAVSAYEARRRPRAELVLKLSRRADRAGQLDGALATRVRDLVTRSLPESVARRQLGPIVEREP